MGAFSGSATSAPKACVIGGSAVVTAGGTDYHHPFGADQSANVSELVEYQWTCPRAGTIDNFWSAIKTALGVAETVVVTVRVNTTDSSVTVTHPNSAGAGSEVSDTVNSVSVAAGDNIKIKSVSTDNANNKISWGFRFTEA